MYFEEEAKQMDREEVKLSFDSEKMEALVFYLKKDGTTVQKKMDEALCLLYEQTVPEPLRENLDAKSAPTRPKRPPRPNQPKAAALKPASAPTEHEKEGGV